MQASTIPIPAIRQAITAVGNPDRAADDQSSMRSEIDDAWAAVSLARLAAYSEGRTAAAPVDAAIQRVRKSRCRRDGLRSSFR